MFTTTRSIRQTVLAGLTAVALSAALPAVAQTAAPPAESKPAASAKDKAAMELAFSRADVNGDGKLSKEEAARMPAIAAKFDELDISKDGSLSMEEFAVGYFAAVN